MSVQLRTREAIAREIAGDIADGSYVNLGIGIPTLVSDFVSPDKEIILHSENGILGLGPAARRGEEDYDLVNAGKVPVTLLEGGCYFHHADSFAMMRGGHLDIAVLGAYQVSFEGDLANWHTGGQDIPAVGGAMDLAVGARQVWVAMPLLTREGRCKIVPRCSYPLTAPRCTTRVYTDHATLAIHPDGLQVLSLAEGLTLLRLEELLGCPLRLATPD
jgi:3-oxoadipate CoA-transferase beta subunit